MASRSSSSSRRSRPVDRRRTSSRKRLRLARALGHAPAQREVGIAGGSRTARVLRAAGRSRPAASGWPRRPRSLGAPHALARRGRVGRALQHRRRRSGSRCRAARGPGRRAWRLPSRPPRARRQSATVNGSCTLASRMLRVELLAELGDAVVDLPWRVARSAGGRLTPASSNSSSVSWRACAVDRVARLDLQRARYSVSFWPRVEKKSCQRSSQAWAASRIALSGWTLDSR